MFLNGNTNTQKTCSHCACALPLAEFVSDKYADPNGRSLGVSSVCKFCKALARKFWEKRNPVKFAALKKPRRKRYRAKKLNATPAWADREEVAMWYEVATVLSRSGVEFHVDHIVPLRSPNVCGLHVHTNLTVVPWHVNIAKGNRHWPDMPV